MSPLIDDPITDGMACLWRAPRQRTTTGASTLNAHTSAITQPMIDQPRKTRRQELIRGLAESQREGRKAQHAHEKMRATAPVVRTIKNCCSNAAIAHAA